MSLAIWDHTVLPSTRHKWTHSAFTPARQVGTRFMWRDRRLSWPRWFVTYRDGLPARRWVTTTIIMRSKYRGSCCNVFVCIWNSWTRRTSECRVTRMKWVQVVCCWVIYVVLMTRLNWCWTTAASLRPPLTLVMMLHLAVQPLLSMFSCLKVFLSLRSDQIIVLSIQSMYMLLDRL